MVAANVDVALLVASLNSDLNLRRLERYLATTYESGADPVIVLTKSDLAGDFAERVAEVEAIAFGAPVLALSSKTHEGLDALAAYLRPGRTAVLLGSSGRGQVHPAQRPGRRGEDGHRRDPRGRRAGRHTTTHRELVRLALRRA